MDAKGIEEVLREVFGNTPTKIINGWVSIRCPLAPWTHESGRDSSASAGVSINDNGTSIFNCFAASTLVRTRGGTAPIGELAGTTTELQMPDGSWAEAPVQSFGRARLYKLILSRNGVRKEILTTAGHRWFAMSAGGGEIKEKTTVELRTKERLQVVQTRCAGRLSLDRGGFLHGAFYGDGTANTNGVHGRLTLFGAKRELLPYFDAPNIGHNSGREYMADHSYVSGPFAHLKGLPDLDADESYLRSFIAGWIATDGAVSQQGVSVSSASEGALEWLRDCAIRLGIEVYDIREAWRQGYGSELSQIYTLRFVASTLPSSMFLRADQRRAFESRIPAYERLRWSVQSVEDTGTDAEVFCAVVPQHHAFVLDGGIVTGNCYTCKVKGPLHYLIQRYGEYTGENFDSLIEELEDEAYLGARVLPNWGELFHDADRGLVPLKKSLYLGLYESAAGHPYLVARGISEKTAEKLQLMVDPSDPADGEERILFPVFGPGGELYGLSGRATNKTARLKVRDYYGLKKAQCLLGSHLITLNKPSRILVVEGLFDYANGWECDQPTVAVMHSTMTLPQAEIIRDFGLSTYLFYDNDEAGRSGVAIAGDLLMRYVPTMKVRYMEDETGYTPKDPGELHAAEFEAMIFDARLY